MRVVVLGAIVLFSSFVEHCVMSATFSARKRWGYTCRRYLWASLAACIFTVANFICAFLLILSSFSTPGVVPSSKTMGIVYVLILMWCVLPVVTMIRKGLREDGKWLW